MREQRGPTRHSKIAIVATASMHADDSLRRDVALANRIIERVGLSNAFGHVSARIPGTDTFLLPTRRSPGFADEHTLLVLDFEGNVRAGTGTPNSELWIHARAYAARDDLGSVVHAHPPACVCLTQIGERHRIVHNQGGAFARGVAEYDDIGLIRTRELGDQLAASLGNRVAVMMRGHGVTTGAADVRTATVAACFLEESAALHLRMLAAAGGDATRIRVFTHEEAMRLSDQLSPGIVERAWEYFAALAERPLNA
jgi:ribulose-5-phosphate 4-epimerase/fuculose-1-phosphate aldolase